MSNFKTLLGTLVHFLKGLFSRKSEDGGLPTANSGCQKMPAPINGTPAPCTPDGSAPSSESAPKPPSPDETRDNGMLEANSTDDVTEKPSDAEETSADANTDADNSADTTGAATDNDESPSSQDETGDATSPAGKGEKKQVTGGRRTEGNKPGANTPPSSPRLPRFIPELVCVEKNRQWHVAVAASEEIAKVMLNGNQLEKDREGHYFLPCLDRLAVALHANNQPQEHPIELSEAPLIFQTQADWRGVGRRVKAVSPLGHYVVLAHDSCGKRLNSHPPIEMESAAYSGWQAHFFAPNDAAANDGFEHCRNIISHKVQFSLAGKTIPDHSDAGELFVAAPMLEDKAGNFAGVSEIHIGEEGKSGWRKSFPPAESIVDMLEEHGGWFFIRLYNNESERIFSSDFRVLPGLSGIIINGNEDWAETPITGDSSARVKFTGKHICVEPVNTRYIFNEEDNTFTIPADSSCDKTEWRITNEKGHAVNVTLVLPRIRWQYDHAEQKEWTAAPIQFNASSLRDATYASKGIKVLCPRFIKKIHAGIGDRLDKDYLGILSEDKHWREFCLPLMDFADDAALENSAEIPPLYIGWDNNSKLPLVMIANETPPKEDPDATADSAVPGQGTAADAQQCVPDGTKPPDIADGATPPPSEDDDVSPPMDTSSDIPLQDTSDSSVAPSPCPPDAAAAADMPDNTATPPNISDNKHRPSLSRRKIGKAPRKPRRKWKGFSRAELTKAGLDKEKLAQMRFPDGCRLSFDKRRRTCYCKRVNILLQYAEGGNHA